MRNWIIKNFYGYNIKIPLWGKLPRGLKSREDHLLCLNRTKLNGLFIISIRLACSSCKAKQGPKVHRQRCTRYSENMIYGTGTKRIDPHFHIITVFSYNLLFLIGLLYVSYVIHPHNLQILDEILANNY